MDCWNDFTKQWMQMPRHSPTVESLRQPSKYHVISDAQLKRDLKGRTLKDVYRENRASRERGGTGRDYNADLAAYQAWCQANGHEPHPASLDADHPIAKQRESIRYVKRGD